MGTALHVPVLLDEVMNLLDPGQEEALLVDANLGEGGHAEAFLDRFPGLTLLGVEADSSVARIAVERLGRFGSRARVFVLWADEFFADYDKLGSGPPDRILFDLGVSTYHYERAGRGFSFRRDEPLDMRLDLRSQVSARDIVNGYPEGRLADLLYEFGEERLSRRIARAIVRERGTEPIETSGRLADIIARAVPPGYRHRRIHAATRSFQALRIGVNDELERLRCSLEAACRILRAEGRMGVISFHSLEDRIVKRFFRQKNKSCNCPADAPICQCGGVGELKILTKKPIAPGAEEIGRNPASRSAKFRVAEKIKIVGMQQ